MARAAYATPVRVVVGDCHEVFAHGIRRHLKDERRFVVVGRASDGAELVAMAEDLQPDLVLVDAELPGVGTVEATRRITAADPSVAVVIMTSPGSRLDYAAAEEAGAAGFLRKDISAERFVTAIPAVSDVVSALAQIPTL
jgi:DNA-binding NarL/FixJ family response regulator